MPKETDRLKLPLPLGNENVTRESINGIFEKIDAGVATRESILIPAESDLNSYITEGEYYCPTNATVGTLANSPVGVAFHLTIERHAGVVQTLTTFEPSNLQVFQRNYYVGWGPWKKVPTREELEDVIPQANASAQTYVNSRPWQKFPLTQDTGMEKSLSGGSGLNAVTTPGYYYIVNPVNGPTSFGNYHIEVVAQSATNLIQKATSASDPPNVYVRSLVGTTWSLWVLQNKRVWGAL
ncbi:pyocin knob domain-containing protein [Paenibacillus sp. FSL K6-1122]|uniref:pyocin knob domain-containing protein n=1 Tax=Paenibacillus TaxID=44249 RepID=UPI00096BFA8D|nr:pyocin knob domain-containing protein [Paenibacillus amylolyticus]OMF10366.1 hypothetical protein BK129_06115 [Paenibacillus amylolyticus]